MNVLVWVTNNFRLNSRLISNLSNYNSNTKFTFVYFSPYYFSLQREKDILKNSKLNYKIFKYVINNFKEQLQKLNHDLYIFKDSDPINKINELVNKYNYEQLIIDQPLFDMWKNIRLKNLNIKNYKFIDSCLISDVGKYTAKSRLKCLLEMKYIKHNDFNLTPFLIDEKSEVYNIDEISENYKYLLNPDNVLNNALLKVKNYKETRDRYFGQTNMSIALQNGVIDPYTLFYNILHSDEVKLMISKNDENSFSLLRQLCFRDINIEKIRIYNLTLENNIQEFTNKILDVASYYNLNNDVLDKDLFTKEQVYNGNTGDKSIDELINHTKKYGLMPNRGRMYFISRLYYSFKRPYDAIEVALRVFDTIGLDGQSPNNYMSVINALRLQYGKVTKFSEEKTFKLLKNK